MKHSESSTDAFAMKNQINPEKTYNPKKSLTTTDAVALIVGLVVGAGIFKTPSLVAANVETGMGFIGVWVLGGLFSFIGALCYAELTTAYPNAGGDYHFIRLSFGRKIAFLFAWARMSVIQTGSIALLAFIFGDYATQLFSLGEFSSVIYAALAICLLTGINIIGVNMGTGVQKVLTLLEIVGILLLIGVGVFYSQEVIGDAELMKEESVLGTNFGLAMVFVLLTFGGWNEAAYISAELKYGRKQMVRALIIGIGVITLLYTLINLSYLKVLGLEGMAGSTAIASDMMLASLGRGWAIVIVLLVAVAALTSANATIFTGARSNYALGRDFEVFSALGNWNHDLSVPKIAFLVQGVISLLLVGLGVFSRDGFETMVEYTAPVFWFFFLLAGIALFILRVKNGKQKFAFQVPLYPVLPIIFCLTSLYLLYSSIAYTGWGALVGIGVLVLGFFPLFLQKRKEIKSK
ncbi:amino acid permease [Litoribacter ruber]|uniref:Amino acid permease n=1 Tax=Litoribacter ruber TaxID=702568 RepID=A0AAP2CFJ0_9BACT|nr:MULTISPECIES: amino acid permease [Litoribacter]MBS9523022.1 amino acid permease [Litoribacter alkaliphilus]MBT0810814.1 amino acid permease [Litoribacter ruber]